MTRSMSRTAPSKALSHIRVYSVFAHVILFTFRGIRQGRVNLCGEYIVVRRDERTAGEVGTSVPQW